MITSAVQPIAQRPPAALGGKYLTFRLGAEAYGVEILKVREIIGLLPITPTPRTPSYVRGVINLRGKVMPVLDLAERLGLARSELRGESCIVVVEVDAPAGLVVDAVLDVLTISDDLIEPAPSIGARGAESFVRGIAKCGGELLFLLDVERVLRDAETGPCEGAAAAPRKQGAQQ